MGKVIDITGQKFGYLTVVRFDCRGKFGPMWLCKCDCGNEKSIRGSYLKNGTTKSCGCHKLNVVKSIHIKHGQSRNGKTTREYVAWQEMRKRCYKEDLPAYKDYGGRGITVCDRWRDSFENFFEDMGERPSSKHSLDRYPDNNGNYEPGNCRWATKEEQAANCRSNHWIELDGKKMILSDWAKYLDTTPAVLCRRIKNKKSIVGRKKNVAVLNLETGIFYDTMKDASISVGINPDKFAYLMRKNNYSNKFMVV